MNEVFSLHSPLNRTVDKSSAMRGAGCMTLGDMCANKRNPDAWNSLIIYRVILTLYLIMMMSRLFLRSRFLSVWLDQNFLTTLSDPADLSVSDTPLQEDTQFSLWDREEMRRRKWSVCLILKEKVKQSEGSFTLLQVLDIFDHLTEIKCVCTGRLWSDVILHSAFKLGSEVRTNLK